MNHEFIPAFRALSDEDGGGYLVEYPDLPGCMADGDTLEQALEAGREAVSAWIETAKAEGRAIPEPGIPEAEFSGKWVQRVPKSLHAKLVARAKAEGVSLNTLVISCLAEAVGQRTQSSATLNTTGGETSHLFGSALSTTLQVIQSNSLVFWEGSETSSSVSFPSKGSVLEHVGSAPQSLRVGITPIAHYGSSPGSRFATSGRR